MLYIYLSTNEFFKMWLVLEIEVKVEIAWKEMAESQNCSNSLKCAHSGVGWALHPTLLWSLYAGQTHAQTHEGERHVTTGRGGGGSGPPTCQATPSNTRRSEKGMGHSSLHSEGAPPTWHPNFGLQASQRWENTFLLFQLPGVGYFVRAAPANRVFCC